MGDVAHILNPYLPEFFYPQNLENVRPHSIEKATPLLSTIPINLILGSIPSPETKLLTVYALIPTMGNLLGVTDLFVIKEVCGLECSPNGADRGIP